MGMSDILEERRARGFNGTDGERVCLECVLNAQLRHNLAAVVDDVGIACVGCGRFGVNVDAEEILTEMVDAVRLRYGYALNFMPIESGSFVFDTTDTRELVQADFYDDLIEPAFEALIGYVDDEVPVARDLDRSDDLNHAWEEFETFAVRGKKPAWGSGSAFLGDFGEFLSRNPKLLKNAPPKGVYWRVRELHSPKSLVDYDSADQMGSPPPTYASDSRFSPKGTPMFYGAEDARTAVAEVFQGGVAGTAIVGSFEVSRALTLLDLVALPEPPSIYDRSNTELFLALRFLRNFAREVSKPVVKTMGSNHYAATQGLTKMIKSLESLSVDGIRYSSSLTDQPCVAVFAEAVNCADSGAASIVTLLVYQGSYSEWVAGPTGASV
ncbi:RES family NAD+ phosphorylase [Cryobacterium sp. AP23]